jgi:hypothetical protein
VPQRPPEPRRRSPIPEYIIRLAEAERPASARQRYGEQVVITQVQLRGQSVCRPADSTSAILVAHLANYASATSGGEKTVRDSLHLPLTQASQVKLVTQETVCKKARDAYAADRAGKGVGGSSGRVYVVAIGNNGYAIVDPAYNYASPMDWTILIVDKRFLRLGLLG